MKTPLQIIRTLLLFSGLILVFPSSYGAAICSSSSSTNATDTLTDSGGSGGNYSNNQDCSFLIQPTGAGSVTLTFSAFNLENNYDYLRIYDGTTTGAPLLATLSGTSLPTTITSTTGAMLVRFTSDFIVTRRGFVANWTSAATSSCPAQSVGDNFPSVSYSQNSGSQNWSGNWIEVGESDGTSAGIARVRSDLCSGGNCLRLGVPSGSSAQTYSNRGVYRQADLSGASSATLSFVYRRGVAQGSQTIVLSISSDGGSSWNDLNSYFFNSSITTPVTESINISAFTAADTRIRFLATGNNAVIGFYIDNLNINYQPTCTLPPTVNSLSTSDTMPVITGTFDSGSSSGGFIVTVNSISYTLGASTELTNSGDDWTLDLSSSTPLAIGVYDVVAVSDDGAGNTASDSTTDELTINAPVCNVNFRDDFGSVSFGNNGGTESFSGNWEEYEGSSLTAPEVSPDQSSGHVVITGGQLVLGNFSPESPNAPGVVRELDLSSYTSATFTFDFQTSAGVDNDDSLLVQASDDGGATWTLLEDITGIGGTTGSKSYGLTPFISANTQISLRFNTAINSGACCYGAAGETISFDNINIAASGACPAVDHYAISHGGAGITCEPKTVTVTAHNADHSPYNVTSDVVLTVTTNPAVDAITSTPVTITTGQSSAAFTLTETSVTIAPHIDINVDDTNSTETSGSANATDDPRLAFYDSLFQFVTNTSIPPTTDINTQIGGKPSSTTPNAQNLYLRAVRTDDTTGSPVCVAALDAGTHAIDMGYQCIDSANCSTTNQLSVSNNLTYDPGTSTTIARNDGATTTNTLSTTLDFDASGYAPLSFQYNNVGEIALFADAYSTLSGGEINNGVSDQFVVRPFALVLDFDDGGGTYDMRQLDWGDGNLDGSSSNNSYSDPTNIPQNSSVFQIAGTNFPAEMTGVLWQGSDDSNADGEPDNSANLYDNAVASLFGQESSRVIEITHSLEVPGGGNVGTLTSTFSNPYINGRSEGTMNWDEVGIIDIQLALNSYLTDTSFTPSSIAQDVGRFTPARFAITNPVNGDLDASCSGNFSYIGQEFGYSVPPSFVIEAQNASNVVTQNYQGSAWAKILSSGTFSVNTVIEDETQVGTDGTTKLIIYHGLPTSRINSSDNSNGTFNASFGADVFCYGSDDLVTNAGCNKATESQVAPFNSDIKLTLSSIGDGDITTPLTQDFLPTGRQQRYGRLALDNVFGSELTPLQMPMYTEFFNGNNFVDNTADNCTTVDHTILNELGVVAESAVSSSVVTVSSITANMGELNVDLTSPGANNTGAIDVTPNLDISVDPWLKYDWDTSLTGLENPSASATFGIYKGNEVNIYIQQTYQ